MYFFAVNQVPSKPGRPVVKSIVGRKVTIEWAAPEYDGGARISYYVIHYGAIDDSDIESMVKLRVTGRKTVYTITKRIRLNKQYKFAVAAVNKKGVGPLSQFSECVNTPRRLRTMRVISLQICISELSQNLKLYDVFFNCQ